MPLAVVGLDIGGANVKAAHSDGVARTRPFALWRRPERLPEVLRDTLASLPPFDLLAVTMTAELADCYATKAEGVVCVLEAVERTAAGRPVQVWQTGAEFVPVNVAKDIPQLVAAANWHALATFVGRLVPHGPSLLLDVGSTTTDLVPLQDGLPVPAGLTDKDRLLSGELVYTGARRTPVCAVVDVLPLGDRLCPVAAELFATTLDVYLLLGDVPERPEDNDTADGRPATRPFAHGRLARMLCCDGTELPLQTTVQMAQFVARRQLERLVEAARSVLRRLPGSPQTVLVSGSGEFLARRVVDGLPELAGAERVSLRQCFSPEVSEAACAFAVARLACERLDGFV